MSVFVVFPYNYIQIVHFTVSLFIADWDRFHNNPWRLKLNMSFAMISFTSIVITLASDLKE